MTGESKAEWLAMKIAGRSDNAIIYGDAAAAELRRLSPMEQELAKLKNIAAQDLAKLLAMGQELERLRASFIYRSNLLEKAMDDLEALRAECEALKALAPVPAVPDGSVPSGSKEHLKLLMEASAWRGSLELGDALRNIDDFFALSAAPQPAQQAAQ